MTAVESTGLCGSCGSDAVYRSRLTAEGRPLLSVECPKCDGLMFSPGPLLVVDPRVAGFVADYLDGAGVTPR